MALFTINITKEFLEDLRSYMRLKGFSKKSEAIRTALKEAVHHAKTKKRTTNFRSWTAMGLRAPLNSKSRFSNEDEIWEKK